MENSQSLQIAKKLLGKEVEVTFDRPLGTKHPKHGFIYEANYGYVEGIKAPDGEDLDAYYLGVSEPLTKEKGICIAVAHRKNDDDDKLIVAPQGISMSDEEIMRAIHFQEQWFDTEIIRDNNENKTIKAICNEQTKSFLEELKSREDVVGVILFGSWARGNNRPNSDVDLVVILDEGYQRCVENKNGQIFEIIYITEKGAFDFWESNKDDAYGLWSVAKILYDRNGKIQELKERITDVLNVGKKEINNLQLEQFRFDAVDLTGYVEEIMHSDPLTAKLLIFNKVFSLTEMFFDIRQMWTPAPKQRLLKIKEISPDLYELLEIFYSDNIALTDRIKIVRQIIPIVFEK
jgi:inorganic pyrophosphatase